MDNIDVKVEVGDKVIVVDPTNELYNQILTVTQDEPEPTYLEWIGEHIKVKDGLGKTHVLQDRQYKLAPQSEQPLKKFDKVIINIEMDSLKQPFYSIIDHDCNGIEIYDDDGKKVGIKHGDYKRASNKDVLDLIGNLAADYIQFKKDIEVIMEHLADAYDKTFKNK